MSDVLFGLSIVMLIAAVPLLLWGLRGRVVDDHPYCRRCGFDLYGFDRGSCRCPECGKPIGRSRGRWYLRDVRIGRRERRVGPLSWGLALGLPAVGWLVMLAVATFGGDDMYARAPGWLLDWEARIGGGVAARAVDELSRRACAGTLSPARENALVARFLDEQQDLSRPWVHEKGDFLGYLRRAGRLKSADWDRYVAQAVAAALTVRPLVRLGTPVPFSIQLGNLRFGTASGPAFGKSSGPGGQGVTLRVIARDANGTVYALGHKDQYWVRSHFRSPQSTPPTTPTIDGAIEVRPAIARSEWRFGMWAEENVSSSTAPAPTTLPSWPAGVVPFAFAPPDQRTAVARAHPRMREEVRRNLRLRLIPTFPVWASAPAASADAGGVRRLDVPPAGSRAFTVEFDLHREDAARWPLPVSWAVAIRFGGTERPVGIVGFPREPEIAPRLLIQFPEDDGPVAGEHIDVILRPSPEFAERSLGLTEYWDGEIQFRDIPVTLHGSPHAPN